MSKFNDLSQIEFEILTKKATALVEALNNSSTSLWKPPLEDTEECITWNSTAYMSSDDDDAELIELPGIQQEYIELCQALGIHPNKI